MYHGYRAWPKDGSLGPVNFKDIAWHALTDNVMKVMAGGMVVLSFAAKSG
jgi:hypothetical protein